MLVESLCFLDRSFTFAIRFEGMTREQVIAMYCRISPTDPGWVLAGQARPSGMEDRLGTYDDEERMVGYFLEDDHVVLTDIALAVTKAHLQANQAKLMASHKSGGPDLRMMTGFQALLEKFKTNLVPSMLLEVWARWNWVSLNTLVPDHIRVCVHSCLMTISGVVRATQAPSLFPRPVQQILAGASYRCWSAAEARGRRTVQRRSTASLVLLVQQRTCCHDAAESPSLRPVFACL